MKSLSEGRPWTLLSSWMNIRESENWQKKINKNLTWEQPVVRIYGSSYLVPRKTKFIAENKICYSYSGIRHYGNGWPNWFYPLLEMVNSASNVKFNGCLLNLYRNGYDRMGWHSDNEPELDLTKPISSLSLGAIRDFVLKHRTQEFKESLSLQAGDLLIMNPICQKEWIHSIPIRRNIKNERINLTFRCYKKD